MLYKIQFIRKFRLWKHFADFFPAKIIKTCDYDPKKNYIFRVSPPWYPLGRGFCSFCYRGYWILKSAVSASRKSISHLLGNGNEGRALGLVVGGAPESLDCHPDKYPNPPGSRLRTIQDALQKVIGLAPCIFIGRGIFQYSFGIVPFRKPINTLEPQLTSESGEPHFGADLRPS
ncbi:2-acylglycerol O-acyltransferase 1 [Armadillidium vulgare]|nr:2-acylglycerol O-acyltransferase 1 [Armadillidium vulgare]